MTNQVLFDPFVSAVDASFWHRLTAAKLDTFKLNDAAVALRASFTPTLPASDAARASARPLMAVTADTLAPGLAAAEGSELAPPDGLPRAAVVTPGSLVNTNSSEDFKSLDKAAHLAAVGRGVWEAIIDGRAEADPSLLATFTMVTYADIKKWTFVYWFAFPACLPDGFAVRAAAPPTRVGAEWDEARIAAVSAAMDAVRERDGQSPAACIVAADGSVHPLSAHGDAGDDALVVCMDASAQPDHPGWLVRNLAVLAKVRWGKDRLRVLCWRNSAHGGLLDASSPVLTLELDGGVDAATPVKFVGWEPNARGKMGPRLVDLGAMMDPTRLATTSVDLNLKLMRWRLLPSLDLERIASTKCLLLGAGTLGCNVARALMGWGVRHITFVDNGKVSFSNPVRQTLFTHADCLDGGRPKAQAAAERLREIFPSMQSSGHMLSIPMPGHAVGKDEAGVRKAVAKLEELIREHDVVFLLTDTRESRWLPTVLAKVNDRPLFNAAMGFDTYLVMRHGAPDGDLGCYFCNDVVAPSDSLTRRSLDQQCTVTRPGLSMMTSAVVVELMIAILHHADGYRAPGDAQMAITEALPTPLGILPHQIRGFLGHFSEMIVSGAAFERCTACSKPVLDAFKARGIDFCLDVFNGPASVLEEITGLHELHAAAAAAADAWDEDIDDEDGW